MQYPVNAVKIQASKVIAYGDYVFFVCLGEIPDDLDEDNEEAILAEAMKDNQIAVDKLKEAIDCFSVNSMLIFASILVLSISNAFLK